MARRTTSPADTPRIRALVSSEARSSGDIRTINRADATIGDPYIYICMNIVCLVRARKRLTVRARLGSGISTAMPSSRAAAAIRRSRVIRVASTRRAIAEVKHIRCSQPQIEVSRIRIGQPSTGGMHPPRNSPPRAMRQNPRAGQIPPSSVRRRVRKSREIAEATSAAAKSLISRSSRCALRNRRTAVVADPG